MLVEPFFYRVSSPHYTTIGSSAYVLYGLTDRLTAGFIPVVGSSRVDGIGQRSPVGVGDVTALAQYGLTQYHDSWIPAIGIGVQLSLPTGRFDQLGERPSDWRGSGAYSTTLTRNTQTYFWVPNGRILRMRLNGRQASRTRSTRVTGSNVFDPSGAKHDAESGASRMFGYAPAVEYNWSSNLGVLFGTRVITAGGGTNASITPAIAINFVH